MNSSFARILAATERTYANTLIGKNISFVGVTETGDANMQSGIVEQVYNDADGGVFLERLVLVECCIESFGTGILNQWDKAFTIISFGRSQIA